MLLPGLELLPRALLVLGVAIGLTGCATAGVAPAEGARTGGLAITGGAIVDVVAGGLIEGKTVIVEGKRIAAILDGPPPADLRVIDGKGKFLIPGLWDMHVHLFNHNRRPGTTNEEAHFRLYTANGVTRVRDMWSMPAEIAIARQWQQEVEAGTAIGPYVCPASSIVDGSPAFSEPGVALSVVSVKNEAEARQAVRDMKAAGADFVKIYWTLSPEAFRAIADETRKLGMTFAGHVPFLISAFEASESGQKTIEHLTGILETCSSREEELRFAEWSEAVDAAMFASFDREKCRRLFQAFATNGTWSVPTLVLHRGLALHDRPQVSKNPDLDYLAPQMVADWSTSPQLDRVHDEKARQQRFRLLLDLVADLAGAGAGLLAGTDNNNPYVVPGFALHDEMALFVEAGLTPAQALRSATIDPARFMKLDRETGSIEAGKAADIVLLDANPLEDIRNTRKIHAVLRNGVHLERKTLDTMLAEAAEIERRQDREWASAAKSGN